MPLLTDLNKTLAVLENDGLVLLPTQSTWSIACDSQNQVAIQRLLRIYQQVKTPPGLEVLVDSIGMLKRYVPVLHPRLETLLVYHQRPLAIRFEQYRELPMEAADARGAIALRLVHSDFCTKLIGHLGRPLLGMFASLRAEEYPMSFGAISSAIFERVDYVTTFGRSMQAQGPPVMVTLSQGDELVFLRE